MSAVEKHSGLFVFTENLPVRGAWTGAAGHRLLCNKEAGGSGGPSKGCGGQEALGVRQGQDCQ